MRRRCASPPPADDGRGVRRQLVVGVGASQVDRPLLVVARGPAVVSTDVARTRPAPRAPTPARPPREGALSRVAAAIHVARPSANVVCHTVRTAWLAPASSTARCSRSNGSPVASERGDGSSTRPRSASCTVRRKASVERMTEGRRRAGRSASSAGDHVPAPVDEAAREAPQRAVGARRAELSSAAAFVDGPGLGRAQHQHRAAHDAVGIVRRGRRAAPGAPGGRRDRAVRSGTRRPAPPTSTCAASTKSSVRSPRGRPARSW